MYKYVHPKRTTFLKTNSSLTKIVRQKRMENTYTLTAHFLGREELEDWSHPFVLSLQHLDCQHYDGRFPGPQADA